MRQGPVQWYKSKKEFFKTSPSGSFLVTFLLIDLLYIVASFLTRNELNFPGIVLLATSGGLLSSFVAYRYRQSPKGPAPVEIGVATAVWVAIVWAVSPTLAHRAKDWFEVIAMGLFWGLMAAAQSVKRREDLAAADRRNSPLRME